MGGEIRPYEPWESWLERLRAFERELVKATSEFFASVRGPGWEKYFSTLAEADVSYTSERVVVKFPTPGAKPDHLDVLVDPTQVAVRGRITRSTESDSGRSSFTESFYRSVALPAPVLPDTAETKVEDDFIVVSARKA